MIAGHPTSCEGLRSLLAHADLVDRLHANGLES